MQWAFTFLHRTKIATIDFRHFVGFCIDISKNFIKIRGSKLCLSHYLKIDQGKLKYKIRYKFGKEYLRKETFLFQFEYINLKVLLHTKFSKKLGTIIIKPYIEKSNHSFTKLDIISFCNKLIF